MKLKKFGSLFNEGSFFPTIWWQNMDFDGIDIQGYLLTDFSSSLSSCSTLSCSQCGNDLEFGLFQFCESGYVT
jgi:hypothetical protein